MPDTDDEFQPTDISITNAESMKFYCLEKILVTIKIKTENICFALLLQPFTVEFIEFAFDCDTYRPRHLVLKLRASEGKTEVKIREKKSCKDSSESLVTLSNVCYV